MLPTTTLEGRLTADPELRFTPGGKGICSFTVVCSDRRKNDSTNEWEDVDPTFFRVTAWERLGENCAESLRKGDLVLVIGKLKQREYTTRDNEKRTSYQEVTANNVGASMLFRTIKHNAVQRGSQQTAPAPDPWATPATTGGDDPPF